MNAARTRASLLSRVLETQRRAAAAEYQPRHTRRVEVSFTERYRGTEFETLAPVMTMPRSSISRGRAFVIMSGAATLGLAGLILASRTV
jgi:hypothetical protein